MKWIKNQRKSHDQQRSWPITYKLPGWITALFNEFARTGATDIFLIALSIATAPFIILNDLLDWSIIPVNDLAVLNASAAAVAPTVAEGHFKTKRWNPNLDDLIATDWYVYG